MSDKNINEWLFADIDDLIDCDYSDESNTETVCESNQFDITLEESAIDLIKRQQAVKR